MSRWALSLALAAALLATPARGAGAEEATPTPTPTSTSTSTPTPTPTSTPTPTPTPTSTSTPTPTSTSTPTPTSTPTATPTPTPTRTPAAWTAAGEVSVGALAATLHGVDLRGTAFRLGLGGHQPGGWPGRDDSDLAALVTAGGFVGRTTAGLATTELRLGVGVRARLGRFLLGADAEAIQLTIDRASTGGHLGGSGLGARLLVGVQVARLGPAALMLTLEGVLDTLDPFASPDYLTAGQIGIGVRW